MKSAKQLVDELATCVTCGKIHERRKVGSIESWAAADGHSYRTKLFQLTGSSSTGLLGVLRELAKS